MPYFRKRETLGIENISLAKQVVLMVWERRDRAAGGGRVFWPDVMAEMGIDVLLS
jgi:hypothetical protein